MRVRFPVLLMVIGLSLSGCAKETWSKAEFVEWYVGFETNKPKIGYCGSDAKYHYFITRPIDSFILASCCPI